MIPTIKEYIYVTVDPKTIQNLIKRERKYNEFQAVCWSNVEKLDVGVICLTFTSIQRFPK